MAPQSMVTKGPSARGECMWTPSAASSLPVPVSPVISTVASVGAARSRMAKASRMAGL